MSWLSEAFHSVFGGGDDQAQQQAAAAAKAKADADAKAAAQKQADEAAAAQAEQQRQAQALADQQAAQKKAADDAAAAAAAKAKALADYRTGATNQLNAVLPLEFANTWTGDTLTKPSADLAQANLDKANTFISNMLKRGVITDVGAAAANKDLADQGARVRTQIGNVGNTLLGGERSALQDIRGRGVSAISNLNTGDPFDPNLYAGEAQKSYNDFVASLPDALRAQVGTDLYDTTKLPQIAGAAQGAQNLPFDPAAFSGGYDASAAASQQKKQNTGLPATPKEQLGSAVF